MKTSLFTLLAVILTFSTAINSTILVAQNTSPYWSLAGNSNAATTSKLGTTNGISLRFYTNNVQRMIINSAAGYVGIGISSPVNILTVKSNGSTPSASWINGLNSPVFIGFTETVSNELVLATASNTQGNRSVFQGRRSRGTLAAPSVVANNDYITSLIASAYDGSTFQNPALVGIFVDGVPSGGHVPARISLVTGTNGSDRKERLRVSNTGNFNFNNDQLFLRQADGKVGIGTVSPDARLHVVGTSLFTDHVEVLDGGSNGVGIKATGSTGVYGRGYGINGHDGSGVVGRGPESGVAGFGGYYGVYGLSDPTGNDIGIYGEGSRGVYGVGYSGAGVTGHGNSSGVAGYSVASDGVFGSTDNPAGYAGYFNGDVFSSGTYVGSDRTFKKDIADLTSAMDLVNKLQPKSYTFREDGNYKLMHLPVGKHYGLIAQDVEQILPNLVKASTFKTSKAAMPTKPEVGVVPVKGSVTTSSEIVAFKALNYTELIPIVVKGMQEMDAENKMLKQELAELRQMVMDMKNGRGGSDAITSAFLEQNNPNPVAGNTIIRYKVPVTTTSARLTITNVKGQLIKTINIKSVGAGEVDFNSATLATGAYNYSLWVDGKQVDTKRLIIAR